MNTRYFLFITNKLIDAKLNTLVTARSLFYFKAYSVDIIFFKKEKSVEACIITRLFEFEFHHRLFFVIISIFARI